MFFKTLLFILIGNICIPTALVGQNTNTPLSQPDLLNFSITATSCQSCVDHGMTILKNGGSATDAVLSVALSEIANTGGKFVSYAGFMNMMFFDAKTGKV